MRSTRFRILALLCVVVLLFATVLPPAGAAPVALVAAQLLFALPTPCAAPGFAEKVHPSDPSAAASVPARAPPLA